MAHEHAFGSLEVLMTAQNPDVWQRKIIPSAFAERENAETRTALNPPYPKAEVYSRYKINPSKIPKKKQK